MMDESRRKSIAKQARQGFRRGFTVVELLIVIVVIAILAAITIVSYNGITTSAKESALKSDLATAAKKLNTERAESGSFPPTRPGFIGSNLDYSGGSNAFCVSGTANSKSFRITETGSVQEGECTASVATMQSFTSSQCSALTTYTGSNPAAIVNLTDSRGGTARTYEVAKLADGKCWMLSNLKLGNTTGAIILTPSDSNVASSFSLPQLATTGALDINNPGVYGPVPGDTGAGATNYGYLYNFSAATAGETSSSLATGNAPHSICPANWRMPTTGSSGSDLSQLDISFGGTGSWANSGQVNILSWQPTGPLKGVFAGLWDGNFDVQGSLGYLWSASASNSGGSYARYAYFTSTSVSPGADYHYRHYGAAVRCLLD